MNKHLDEFRRAGHGGTLIGALVYFTVSMAVWVMFGPLGATSPRICNWRRLKKVY